MSAFLLKSLHAQSASEAMILYWAGPQVIASPSDTLARLHMQLRSSAVIELTQLQVLFAMQADLFFPRGAQI